MALELTPTAQSSAHPMRAAWRRALRRPLVATCVVLLCGVGLVSLFAPLFPLPSPSAIELREEPIAPTWPWKMFGEHRFASDDRKLGVLDEALMRVRCEVFGDWQTAHWLGTDAKGRDILARIVWGSRTSIVAALIAALTSLAIGVVYGAVAGFAGGRVDEAMMRLVDVLYSIPFIFLVIFVITLLNEYKVELRERFGIDREVVFYVLIGGVYWLTMARVVRGQVLALKETAFIQAARALGASPTRILFTHVVPNVLPIVIVYLTLTLPSVMLFEAFLSFLGLGVEPPKVSFGILAVDGAEAISPLRSDWWLVLFPALALGAVLFALNVIGDALRDALDPKMRGRT